VQVADFDVDRLDLFAVELGDDAHDAVHRRMRRADIEQHLLGLGMGDIALGRLLEDDLR